MGVAPTGFVDPPIGAAAHAGAKAQSIPVGAGSLLFISGSPAWRARPPDRYPAIGISSAVSLSARIAATTNPAVAARLFDFAQVRGRPEPTRLAPTRPRKP